MAAEPTGGAPVPGPERLDDDTLLVPMPTGIPFVPWTNSVVLLDADRRAHVVDPGISRPGALERALDGVREAGATEVASIVVTHFHPDHIGLAAGLRDATGARLVLGRAEATAGEPTWRDGPGRTAAIEAWGVPASERPELEAVAPATPVGELPRADVLVDDGDALDLPGRRVVALVTPGHTPGHLCLRDVDRRRVLTGDHVLPGINPGLGLGGGFAGNPLEAYLDGLDRVAAFDDHEVVPGHERPFRGLRDRADALAEHHLRRLAEVTAVLRDDPSATVHAIAARVTWSAGWDALRGFHRLSALAQIAMHAELARSGAAADRLAARST